MRLFKHRHVEYVEDAAGEEVFVTQRLPWRTAGAAFGDLPTFAAHRRCQEELRELLQDPAAFEIVENQILTGEELADAIARIEG